MESTVGTDQMRLIVVIQLGEAGLVFPFTVRNQPIQGMSDCTSLQSCFSIVTCTGANSCRNFRAV